LNRLQVQVKLQVSYVAVGHRSWDTAAAHHSATTDEVHAIDGTGAGCCHRWLRWSTQHVTLHTSKNQAADPAAVVSALCCSHK
jgi:hypothetical protein